MLARIFCLFFHIESRVHCKPRITSSRTETRVHGNTENEISNYFPLIYFIKKRTARSLKENRGTGNLSRYFEIPGIDARNNLLGHFREGNSGEPIIGGIS